MQNGHRKFTKEFKVEAVRLVEHSGKSQSQVAKDLGICDTNVQRWCQQFGHHAEKAFPGSGNPAPEQEELRRLKRELEVVRMERDILKKAIAIFSSAQP
jgi:transposase